MTGISTDPSRGRCYRARQVAEERASGAGVSIAALPADASMIHVLGVDYVHTKTAKGGDLYLTTAGFPYGEHLQPDNWFEPQWFHTHREKLEGSGSVYAVPSKPIRGESLGLVVKFSRVGEKVPIDTDLIENVLCCEFNGPFEEFALVDELRHSRRELPHVRVRTQIPLAIYVPPDRMQPSQTGRFQWRIARKVDQHPGITIDILRQYLVIYGWLPGIDAWQAHTMGFLSADGLHELTERAAREVRAKSFSVLDMKPAHIIVQVAGPGRLVDNDGQIEYGLVDFELLERTPEYWGEYKAARQRAYQRRKRDLIQGEDHPGARPIHLPSNLQAVRILGVDFIRGHAESTGGMLWVLGRDPGLFDYYLPERWRTTPQIRFLETHETYFTTSKDNVPLVWKVSRVGERPEAAAFGTDGFTVLARGFNSPFEEVAMAWWLRRRGIPTILPRAIYCTGHRSRLDDSLFDPSRYRSHAHIRAVEDQPILEVGRHYITIWDHWNGPDPAVDGEDTPVLRTVNAAQAVERGLLSEFEMTALVERSREALRAVGVEILRFIPTHLLVFIGPDGTLLHDERGGFRVCLCNFQYLSCPDLARAARGGSAGA